MDNGWTRPPNRLSRPISKIRSSAVRRKFAARRSAPARAIEWPGREISTPCHSRHPCRTPPVLSPLHVKQFRDALASAPDKRCLGLEGICTRRARKKAPSVPTGRIGLTGLKEIGRFELEGAGWVEEWRASRAPG